jgi:hypothetical protein
MVTIRRSSRGAASDARGSPHARQKRAIAGFSWSHAAQRTGAA